MEGVGLPRDVAARHWPGRGDDIMPAAAVVGGAARLRLGHGPAARPGRAGTGGGGGGKRGGSRARWDPVHRHGTARRGGRQPRSGWAIVRAGGVPRGAPNPAPVVGRWVVVTPLPSPQHQPTHTHTHIPYRGVGPVRGVGWAKGLTGCGSGVCPTSGGVTGPLHTHTPPTPPLATVNPRLPNPTKGLAVPGAGGGRDRGGGYPRPFSERPILRRAGAGPAAPRGRPGLGAGGG